ncbi:MAG: GSU2403 family nucleotidyltransferase fold protein [Anaerosomatales bacterium]|nr:GSU2403 family nucleotidyltransferase fold protein [Anaerosomatales bacterium]
MLGRCWGARTRKRPGVLVGTQVFIAIGNLLGRRWSSALRTQDIDVAVDPTIATALTSVTADVHDAPDRPEMGFLPVPDLDPASPTTSYTVRRRGLRVGLITPARGPSRELVSVPRFRAAGQPISHLAYLVRDPVSAAVVDGGATLVRVPDPARFALHKLLVSESRPVTEQAKRQKDLEQSAQALEALFEDRPGDVQRAWTDSQAEGRSGIKRVRRAVQALRQLAPEVAARLELHVE